MAHSQHSAIITKLLLLFLIAANIILGYSDPSKLRFGFYSRTCPNSESIVRSVVQQAVNSDPTMAAALLRLHFHDCFVESSGPQYQVLTGRRDGVVSNKALADEMPEVDEPIDLLKAKFARKGLSAKDLVLLSSAHTIGTTACFFMPRRLYNFTGRGDSDSSINPFFLQQLMARCPPGGDVNIRLPMDSVTGMRFDDQILRNIRQGTAVISSDARLDDDPETRALINSYIMFAFDGRFFQDFSQSMIKLGTLGVKTSATEGEIRRVCSSFN